MTLTVTRLAGNAGAEISGVNLSDDLGNSDFSQILDAFNAHSVLVFRDQNLEPSAQVDFSRRFGPAIEHILEGFRLPGNPEVFVISNLTDDGKPKGAIYAGQYWHTDLSYMAVPAMASMLHAKQTPSAGGDTLFSSQHAAYDTLSPTMQKFLSSLTAVHTFHAPMSLFLPAWHM